MKTKIVYVVTSLDDDVYLEQCVVSAWSARYHNQDCHIVLVCDQDTHATMQTGIRKQYSSELFDEILVQEFPPEQGMMERSRRLKTSLRQLVKGDFLFLDSDTVVCGDLSEVDDYNFDLGMVPNNNCCFRDDFMHDAFTHRVKTLFDVDIHYIEYFYNSGVLFVRDTPQNYTFFELWHKHWQDVRIAAKLKDQPALCKTNIDMGFPVTEMSGDMNCQVQASIKYLHTAKVLHFFSCWHEMSSSISPFFDIHFFEEIKQKGITPEVESLILNCKTSFRSPISLLPQEYSGFIARPKCDLDLYRTHSFALISRLSRNPRLFVLVEKICNKLNHLLYKYGRK